MKNNTLNFQDIHGEIDFIEFEKDNNINWEKWELDTFGEIINVKEKGEAYYKQIPLKGVEIEEDKYYLAFFKYSDEKKSFEIRELAYGLMKYDHITNKVKNIDTGEFEEFDWSVFEKSE